jgi:3-isopropylmalate/(R)-2-methylmalate dehydratase small subunit
MRLLNGWDDIDLTNSFRDRIDSFQATYMAQHPWVTPRPGA